MITFSNYTWRHNTIEFFGFIYDQNIHNNETIVKMIVMDAKDKFGKRINESHECFEDYNHPDWSAIHDRNKTILKALVLKIYNTNTPVFKLDDLVPSSDELWTQRNIETSNKCKHLVGA